MEALTNSDTVQFSYLFTSFKYRLDIFPPSSLDSSLLSSCCNVCLQVPGHIKKGRDVQVTIARRHLVAKYKTSNGEWETAVDEDLTWEINKEESMWTLDPGKYIHVCIHTQDNVISAWPDL